MISIQIPKVLYNKFVFIAITVICIIIFQLLFFSRLYKLSDISIDFLDSTLDIETWLWNYIKTFYLITVIISWIFISYTFHKYFPIPQEKEIAKINEDGLKLFVGNNLSSGETITIPESGLYQNILITGTIGTGKTSSAMYPFVNQLLEQNLGMLILDVKGNFYKKILELNEIYHRNVIVLELNGKYTYNPLDKPNLKPSILANRLRTILTLFSNQQVTDTYWLDKVESYLTECIKLCRLYNDNYVTFIELHKLINSPEYLEEKISVTKNKFLSNLFSVQQIHDFNSLLDFFQTEYKTLDSKVLSIIQSEVSRVTQIFVNDYEISNAFCPPKSKVTFSGFSNLENDIVVLNMNVAEYRNLSKILATYLKLDFQSEVLMRLAKSNKIKPVAFLCDEYHEYATENDANFFSESREAKCINIVSTQSYTSLLNAIKNEASAKVIIQSLVNKIWFRADDTYTIEEAQKQLGKEDKVKFSRSISENAKETKYSYILKAFKSDNSSLSESISTQIQHDYIYDFNAFSRELKTFQAICFLSTGSQILQPQVVQLVPLHTQNFNMKGRFI